MTRVSEIMIKDVVFCTPLTKMKDSRNLMKKYHCTKIPVINSLEEKRIIGVVNSMEDCNDEMKVVDCMSKTIRVVEEDATVDECLRVMILNNDDQVPVIDKHGHLCGIVTQSDLIHSH